MIPNAITNSASLQSPPPSAEFNNREEREDSLSLIAGIASLILEGRPIGNEYEISPSKPKSCSVLPSTSNVLRNTSKSNAVSTTAQKIYQLRQKSLVTGLESPFGKINSSTIVGLNEFNLHSRNIEFHQENGFFNANENARNDQSSCLYSLQSLATTCLQSGPSITNSCINFHTSPTKMGCNKVNKCVSGNSLDETKKKIQRLPSMSTAPSQLHLGPHCEQFLKKIGLGKVEPFESDEHYCDISYLNITCSRWKAYCLKIEAIIKRGLPVCIEVYLGPVNHKILLEQWILQINERAITPTMTLPSLCSAIRSQLYFSQISAWCDLIKKYKDNVDESGRVIFGMTNNAAGDLIQMPANITSSSNSFSKTRPRLNIFYRIRHYDSTACFILKPHVHNFPSVNVSENFSVSVCLKSLPRLNGGIPKIGQLVSNLPDNTSSSQVFSDKKDHCLPSSNFSQFNKTDTEIAEMTRFKEQSTKTCDINNLKPSSTTVCFMNIMSEDISQINQNSSDDNNSFYSNNQNYDMKTESECSNSQDGLSHREKQLLKYRKRMLKRDKQLRSCFKSNPIMCLPQFTKAVSANQRNMCETTQATTGSSKELSTAVTKVSIGTQTQTCCRQCGDEKTFSCLNCENRGIESFTNHNDEDDNTFSDHHHTNNYNERNMKPINKAEMLLNAIQRTPQRLKKKCSSTEQNLSNKTKKYHQNNNYNLHNSSVSNVKVGCRVCKRQKIQHTYNDQDGNDAEELQNHDDFKIQKKYEGNDCERSENLRNEEVHSMIFNRNITNLEQDVHETVFKTPTEEDQQIKSTAVRKEAFTQLKDNTKEVPNYGSSENVSIARLKNSSDNQLFTPSAISNNSKALRKSLPKINLTPIFCKTQNTMGDQYWKSIISPDVKEITSPSKGTFSKIESFATIQKSNSAPTLPNPLTLSPRFTKQTKGRSRHISDRSDRSSFCSDEPYSDEEFENSVCSPSTSPNKKKYNYLGQKRCLPLLGNLEESLLQKRFVPKMEVVGFKVLLGASGGFCPTQLTIPASSYFYELHGQNISTPYICEIRLPRKGYAVPRFGTVQVTLLNPTGTVVRMFVVPYDMRDMPPLHCTFVRQRILAENNNTNNSKSMPSTTIINGNIPIDKNEKCNTFSANSHQNVNKEFGHFISPEHMKRLRYCIHLKFQTSRSGRLLLHTDIRLLISRRTDCDTAIAHAKGALESSNDLVIHTFMPVNPTYSMRQETLTKL